MYSVTVGCCHGWGPVKDAIFGITGTFWKEERNEVFNLTTHSAYFIYGYMTSGIIMVKDHSDSGRGNPLLTLQSWASLSD